MLVFGETHAGGGVPAEHPRHPPPEEKENVMDLAGAARKLDADLALNRRPGITDENVLDVQAICVAEEAGELLGAYRRYAGKARRGGTLGEVRAEIADVLIVTAVLAVRLGVDIDAAVQDKLDVIYARGWQEETGTGEPA